MIVFASFKPIILILFESIERMGSLYLPNRQLSTGEVVGNLKGQLLNIFIVGRSEVSINLSGFDVGMSKPFADFIEGNTLLDKARRKRKGDIKS